MENYSASLTPSPVTRQGNDDQGKKGPSPILDCSIISGDQSTIVPDSPSRGDSMNVNSGPMADTEETLLQTPVPLKDYSNARITDNFLGRADSWYSI